MAFWTLGIVILEMFSMSDVILTVTEGKNSYSFIFFCALFFKRETLKILRFERIMLTGVINETKLIWDRLWKIWAL